MKATMEFDCSPEEVRRLLGMPDVTKVNEVYIEALTKRMQTGGFEQLQEYARQVAPMGQAGLKLFQKMVESGATMATRRRGAAKNDA